ncbi:XTP/dITP diphosphatase [Texcoconibacillus texcoconensis]|uniref:dITP/XTP pyrophosphatase n=1 Tax=Texcoconibacillus texcoconensis TaxID=1095777 RepID=A0A840QMV2_9BACI|nr:XTP/dITP diphosphatase [Texcoconibacillus texcoconensis]MBB5172660.1 XTP/dITP diphosphohydrolase [Texcoconibacillus texcoconensis]
MKTIIIATKNEGKVAEFRALFAERGFQIRSLNDIDEDISIIEDASTFAGNACKKAETIVGYTGNVVVADDSGLEVEALDGKPGVYSARYAGDEKNDQANNQKLLRELENVSDEDRKARFVCALAVAFPDRETEVVIGTCEGKIAQEPKGDHGFGYDPVFYLEDKHKTMAQLTSEEKNEISHRANALKKLEEEWKEWF